MKKINVILSIGIIGLLITGPLQLFLPGIEIDILFAKSLQVLCPIFLALVIIGFGLMLKVESKPIDD